MLIFRGVAHRSSSLHGLDALAVISRNTRWTSKPFLRASMASTGKQQPPWKAPEAPLSLAHPSLVLWNSLTRSKSPFVPRDPQGKKIGWYSCGPTVYADAHVGHARNYVTTDIIRRIMHDFFKFEITYVMNYTDVDDKIIMRGRQQYIFSEFKAKNTTLESVRQAAMEAYIAYARKNAPLISESLTPASWSADVEAAYGEVLRGKSIAGDGAPPGDKEAKLKMHLKILATASEALAPAKEADVSVDEFYALTEELLLPYLDSFHGVSIDANNHKIFTDLAQHFERRFREDMAALNCLKPDVVTRVTDYIPQITRFVEKITENTFGYATSDGSVYFDIESFKAAGNHYGRLAPENVNDKDLQADGEGALASKSATKRSDADFALWKASKPGEPSWPSPWGKGRPGWHIECSAMASDVLGAAMDIHSGGIDLAFPHHDNELAQSEAYYNPPRKGCAHHEYQWVNYFMHMGHLHIQGSKMSKSLKNFTTIREALSRGDFTPRGFRIICLLSGWKDTIEITDDLVKAGASFEDKVNNFFLKAKSIEQKTWHADGSTINGTPKNTSGDDTLLKALSIAETETYKNLCDSFNTPKVMRVISDLITEYNSANKATVTDETTVVLANWVTFMVRIFGLDTYPTLATKTIGWSGIDIPEIAKSFVYPVSKLRDEVRRQAKTGTISKESLVALSKDTVATTTQEVEALPYAEILTQFEEDVRNLASSSAPAKDYLKLCDDLRDIKLWNCGIYLEDLPEDNQPALVRPLDKELITARSEREQREKERTETKAKREKEEARKVGEKAEQAKLDPGEMFRTEEFSAWDEDGVPTKNRAGEEVAKSRLKKLRKLWEGQKKAHEAWKKEGGGLRP